MMSARKSSAKLAARQEMLDCACGPVYADCNSVFYISLFLTYQGKGPSVYPLQFGILDTM